MQLSDDLKLIAWPTRVRFDEDDNTPERLAFELEVNGERMVMLELLEQMLDALWSLEEAKLVAPLGSTWWSKAELNKQWGKPVVTVSSESRLERLDMKFAAEHAKKATKATTSPSFWKAKTKPVRPICYWSKPYCNVCTSQNNWVLFRRWMKNG
ncbi:hypothetical protein ACYHK1_28510 (plasmid) [Pseudomonas amygdali pv. morsprunorum]